MQLDRVEVSYVEAHGENLFARLFVLVELIISAIF